MSLAIIITAAILIGQTSQAATCKPEFYTDKSLFQMPASPDFFYCKPVDGVYISSRVSSVANLQGLTGIGYFKNIEKSLAINNSINYYKSTLDPYSATYKEFLLSPVSWVLANGTSVNALTVNTVTTSNETIGVNTNNVLNERISALESLVNQLKAVIDQLATALGLSTSAGDSSSGTSASVISAGGLPDQGCATVSTGACAAGATCTDAQGEAGECETKSGICVCWVKSLSTGLSPYVNRAILLTDNGAMYLPVAGTINIDIISIRSVNTLLAIAYTYSSFRDSDPDGDGYFTGVELANNFNPFDPDPSASLQSMSNIAGSPFTVGMTRPNFISISN